MNLPCDAELHYHDVSLLVGLRPGRSRPAPCACGGGALRVAHGAKGWVVSLLDGTPVLGPLQHDSLASEVDAAVVVGIRRPLSES